MSNITLEEIITAIKDNRVEIFSEENKAAIKKFSNHSFELPARGALRTNTLLIYAARLGRYSIIEILLKWGFDVNQQAPFTLTTPLNMCIQENHMDLAKYLIANGANVNHSMITFTPLTAAVFFNLPDMVKLLIDNKADIDLVCKKFGLTPLCMAAKYGRFDIAKILIENKANINKPVRGNLKTPLQIAIQKGYRDIAKLLIDSGADTKQPSSADILMSLSATQRESTDVIRLLVKNISDIATTGLNATSRARNNNNIDQYLIAQVLNKSEYTPQQKQALLRGFSNEAIVNCNKKVIAANLDALSLLSLSSELPNNSFPTQIAHHVLKQGHGIYACSYEQFLSRMSKSTLAKESCKQPATQSDMASNIDKRKRDNESNVSQRSEKRAKNQPA